MVTNTVSQVPSSRPVKEDRLAIHVTTELKTQHSLRISWRHLLKGFGICSTLLIGAAALAPGVLGIPVGLRPWIFLTSILWFFAFCTGMFNS